MKSLKKTTSLHELGKMILEVMLKITWMVVLGDFNIYDEATLLSSSGFHTLHDKHGPISDNNRPKALCKSYSRSGQEEGDFQVVGCRWSSCHYLLGFKLRVISRLCPI